MLVAGASAGASSQNCGQSGELVPPSSDIDSDVCRICGFLANHCSELLRPVEVTMLGECIIVVIIGICDLSLWNGAIISGWKSGMPIHA